MLFACTARYGNIPHENWRIGRFFSHANLLSLEQGMYSAGSNGVRYNSFQRAQEHSEIFLMIQYCYGKTLSQNI